MRGSLFSVMMATIVGCAGSVTGSQGSARDAATMDLASPPDASTDAPGDVDALVDKSDIPSITHQNAPPLTPSSRERRLVVVTGRTLVRNRNGVWYGWGDRLNVGFGQTPPTPVRSVTRLDLDEQHYEHSFAYASTCRVPRGAGRVPECWGDNSRGALGLGVLAGGFITEPSPLPRLSGIDQIAAAVQCASSRDGTWCWPNLLDPRNPTDIDYGPLRRRERPYCAYVPGVFTPQGEVSLMCGYDCETHHVECTNGATGNILGYFYSFGAADDLIGLSAGWQRNILAVQRDGTLLCRGSCLDNATVLRQGSTREDFRPVGGLPPLRYAVGGLGPVDACAIVEDGTVMCWGECNYHYLGPACDPDTGGGHYLQPTRIPGLTNVVELALGWRHACALTGNHELWCWGNNEFHAVDPTGDIEQQLVYWSPVRIDVPDL